MESKITLCSWCDTPIEHENAILYSGEFICRNCFNNKELINEYNRSPRTGNQLDRTRKIKGRTFPERQSVRTPRKRNDSGLQSDNQTVREVENRSKQVLGKCEYCAFPVYDGDKHYETVNDLYLHEICYPKMAYYRMREWSESWN